MRITKRVREQAGEMRGAGGGGVVKDASEAERVKAVAKADYDYIVDLARRIRYGHATSNEVTTALSLLIDVVGAWEQDGTFPGNVERGLDNWRRTRRAGPITEAEVVDALRTGAEVRKQAEKYRRKR